MIRARTVALLALALVALTLVACGGDEGETTTAPAPTPAEAPSGGQASPSLSTFPPEFVECLADQGIDVEAVDDVSEAIHSPGGQECFDLLHGG
jgi:hypothetical protein